MATRYGVKWEGAQGVCIKGFAFREGAVEWFAGACEAEWDGQGVEGAEIVYMGPNGERWEAWQARYLGEGALVGWGERPG